MSTSPDINLNSILGALLLGLVVHTLLGGVTLVQALQFYRTSGKDPQLLKAFVFVLLILDIIDLAFLVQGNYYYMVQHFGDFEILALPTWGHSMAIYPSAINNFLCSLFMCRRLWILWRLKICFLVPVLSTAVTLSLINFGTTCATSALGWRSHNIEGFSSTTVSTLVKTALATGMTGDMLITGGLCLSLNQNRSKFKETNRIINWISAYIISSCLLTTVTQAFVLVTYVAWPTTDIYIGIYHIVPKLYFNSLLATLNSRASLHKNHGVVNVSTDIPLSGDLSNLEQHSRGRSGVSGRPGNSRPQMLVQLDQQVETTTDSGKLDVIV